MIVEKQDGSLWMLVRTFAGIGEAISRDGRKGWLASRGNILEGPNSRFFIRRLRSGQLLLVNHHRFQGRNNLTVMLSENDGEPVTVTSSWMSARMFPIPTESRARMVCAT